MLLIHTVTLLATTRLRLDAVRPLEAACCGEGEA